VCDVSEMEEGCFGDVFDMLVRGEGLILGDTKVMDIGGGEHSGAIIRAAIRDLGSIMMSSDSSQLRLRKLV